MLIYNGTDYSLYVIIALTVLILFWLQYFLCVKAKRRLVKMLPWTYVLLVLGVAVQTLLTYESGFIDLSGLLAFLFCCYAAICAAAILLAWVVYWRNKRRKNREKAK